MNTLMSRFLISVFLLMLPPWSSAGTPSPSSKFNFSYVLEGDPDIAPSQIFDDGTMIFLQFNHQPDLPNFYLDDGQGNPLATPITPEIQSPYIVIHTLTARLHLNLSTHHAVLVNQSMKQPKGLSSITQTLGSLFSSQQMIQKDQEKKPEPSRPSSIDPSLHAQSFLDQGRHTLIFQAHDREPLSQALRIFLETQGWRLQWDHFDDFVIHEAYVKYGTSLPQLIDSVVSEFHLKAKYIGNAVIVTAPES